MMTVTAIWRYPVKSMAGERVGSTELTETGLVGDRVVSSLATHATAGSSTGERFGGLLTTFASTLGSDGDLCERIARRSREVGAPSRAATDVRLVQTHRRARYRRTGGAVRSPRGRLSIFGLDVLRIVRDRAEAEEILQETFVRVWTRAETIRRADRRTAAVDRARGAQLRDRSLAGPAGPRPCGRDGLRRIRGRSAG